MSDGYQTGWSDGYAEGYACKLADATEPLNPQSLARSDAVLTIAKHLTSKRRADFASDDEAIGLARGIVKALAEGAAPDEPAAINQASGREGLLPCPFCAVDLRKMSEAQGYWHPEGNCTLADLHIEADSYSRERWNTRALAKPDEGAVERVRKLRAAGERLATCAFNLSQRAHLTINERLSLDESRKEWDEAIAALASNNVDGINEKGRGD